MARQAPGLSSDGTVFCVTCGAVHETATTLIAEGQQGLASLGTIIGQKDRRISQLIAEREGKLERSKHYATALDVLDHWHKVCSPKAREPYSEERVQAVIARLAGGFSADDLKLCATGYARRPYVVGRGERRGHGRPTERRVDAELIYRSPKHVEYGLALASKQGDTAPDWRRVRRENHRLILTALADQRPQRDEMMRAHVCSCPRCGEGLTILDPEGAADSLLSCRCGMTEGIFLAALRDFDEPPKADPQLIEALEVVGEQLEQLELPA